MKSQITSAQDSNQTRNLLRAYEKEFHYKEDNIELLRKVCLITPENIHINSFMYEPILDMGDNELRSLYKKIQLVEV